MCSNARLVLSIVATCLLCLSIAFPAASAVTASSFVIRQLYSNQDGNWQFVELEEATGKNGQDQFAGSTLSVTNRHGVTKTFTVAGNLPNAVSYFEPSATHPSKCPRLWLVRSDARRTMCSLNSG